MIDLKSVYPEPRAAAEFVRKCEDDFNSSLKSIAENILSNEAIRCLTLAGPSCSGKTTTAARLTSYLEAGGKRARVISIDDFYYTKAEMELMGISDLEGPAAINSALFKSAAESLLAGRRAKLPVFDFTTRTRAATAEYIPSSGDIYIFEGIQAIYPEITSVLSDFGYKSIYICVADDVQVGSTVFKRQDIRLMRRSVRDFWHRASGIAHTMSLWPAVLANEEANIYPHLGREDFRINSLLPYEIFLLGKYYRELAESYAESEYLYDTVREVLEKLSALSGSAVDISMVPMDSVFREFIA